MGDLCVRSIPVVSFNLQKLKTSRGRAEILITLDEFKRHSIKVAAAINFLFHSDIVCINFRTNRNADCTYFSRCTSAIS